MSTRTFYFALGTAFSLALAGCYGTIGDDDGGDPPPPGQDPPPVDPPLPQPAVYKRGSLAPLYQLTPRAEYGRFVHEGVNMADADFVAAGNAFVSSAQKMDEIAAQIGAERGSAVTIIADASDRQRAQQIPFRGNPSDVDVIELDGVVKAVVPLGGDLMTPGNEVAIVNAGLGTVDRVRVGIRPQRVAVHESGIAFVCNQYSNYISVVDLRRAELLRTNAGPVEIPTEYQCTDLLLVERNPQAQDEDEVDLYVANQFRASVLKYKLEVVRDALSDDAIDVRIVEPVNRDPISQPAAEITGVGSNPWRLSLSEAQDAIYVANSRGGELSRVSLSSQTVNRIALGAPAIDAIQINDAVFVPTTMRDRGLLAEDEAALPTNVQANPVVVTGLDGQAHTAHPGALFDDTKAYNFEDLRNGVFSVNFLLQNSPQPVYFTDDITPEENFADQQKVLEGALPIAAVRNAAGTRIFVANSGSDQVQELEVRSGAFRLVDGQRTFNTEERPFALALDESRNRLYVANWGGETLEVFDLNTAQRLDRIDLGYATADYPATNIERGEYFFYNADWSNNGRKACATCHVDELLADGIGYSNGASAPTTYHQVTPNFNQMTTDSYFWNGSFANGSYTSLALAAQTRTNCELVLFALTEGPSKPAAQRVGDPNNRVRGNDAICRPIEIGADGLPEGFAQIAAEIARQKLIAEQVIEDETGLDRDAVFRFVDFYSVSELRLPPNPLTYLKKANELDQATAAKIDQGQQVFAQAGCGNCHDPNNQRHPFTDGLNHGAGTGWAQRFVDVYQADARILNAIDGGIPQAMLEALHTSSADREINIHLAPVDFFSPFAFDTEHTLDFDDPLVVRGVEPAESDRLDKLIAINLADPDRGFVPGNVPGQPQANTPSLRGTWWKTNFLHNGYAYSVGEAILGPGHSALRPGEDGFAVDALGQMDVHGVTSTLTPEQVEALILYITAIE